MFKFYLKNERIVVELFFAPQSLDSLLGLICSSCEVWLVLTRTLVCFSEGFFNLFILIWVSARS